MHLLIELYEPTAAWRSLDADRRRAFFEGIADAMGGLSALGVEALAFGEIDRALPSCADRRFFAAWRAPDRAALDALVTGIAASGWHAYFETVNAAGPAVDLPRHLKQLEQA